MKRRIVAAMLCLSMLFQMPMISADAKQSLESEGGKIVEIQSKTKLQDLSTFRKSKIESAVKNCKDDGAYAAKQLNGLKSNKEAFEIGVREVLDEYYAQEEVDETALLSFTAEVDETAQEIVENYKEAAEERANADELNYQTEKVMVAFPYGTPMETIETIVANEAVSYEVIDDGEYNVREDLPDYKKERLEKLKDVKKDIIILADVVLEDTVSRAEEKFEQYDCVKYAASNLYLEADETVTSGSYSVTTNDPNFNNTRQWHQVKTNVPQAWKKFDSVEDVWTIWVAVIDCGVQMNHPDLKDVLMRYHSVDVTQNNKLLINCADEASATGQYTGGHGTAVAGVLAAKANNSTLGAGAASIGSNADFRNSIEIMAIKCDNSTSGRHVSIAYLAKAIDYAVETAADVINISYSAPRSSFTTEQYNAVKEAIAQAIACDVPVICSAGNDASEELRYPTAFPGVIGVGAIDSNGILTSYTNESDAVDIVAPSNETDLKQIFTTYPTTINSTGYKFSGGTSCAAPQVTAAVAMMRALNYDLTPSQILTRLQNRATESVTGILDESKTYPVLNTGRSVALTNSTW